MDAVFCLVHNGAQQINEFGTAQLTVRVHDASDIGKDFIKLGVQFPSTPEQVENTI